MFTLIAFLYLCFTGKWEKEWGVAVCGLVCDFMMFPAVVAAIMEFMK